MENPMQTFRETNLVHQLILESRIKNKMVMSWCSRKRKDCIFYNIYFVLRKFLYHLYFISVKRVLSKLVGYMWCVARFRTICTI